MGLRIGDLHDMVYKVLEIDSFASKMGDDKDIVHSALVLKRKQPQKTSWALLKKVMSLY